MQKENINYLRPEIFPFFSEALSMKLYFKRREVFIILNKLNVFIQYIFLSNTLKVGKKEWMEEWKDLKKEWKNGIGELDGRCRNLLLQGHCKKLFNLMDNFWCDIRHVEVDVIWLLRVKTHKLRLILRSLRKFSQKSNGRS